MFVAIKGERLDGHDFAAAALEAGARRRLGRATARRCGQPGAAAGGGRSAGGAGSAGRAGAGASSARVAAITGVGGQDHRPRRSLRLALSASGRHPCFGCLLQQPFGRAADAWRGMPRDARFAVFEIGMNHRRRDHARWSQLVRPHVAVITTIAEGHLGHFGSLDEIAEAKAEIFAGVEPGGVAVINRDTPFFRSCWAAARAAGIERRRSASARTRTPSPPDRRWCCTSDCSCVKADGRWRGGDLSRWARRAATWR